MSAVMSVVQTSRKVRIAAAEHTSRPRSEIGEIVRAFARGEKHRWPTTTVMREKRKEEGGRVMRARTERKSVDNSLARPGELAAWHETDECFADENENELTVQEYKGVCVLSSGWVDG